MLRRHPLRRLHALALVLLLGWTALAAAEQFTLFGGTGEAIAYIDTAKDATIYLFDGTPTSYLYGSDDVLHVYAFDGDHLGWLEHGILWNHDGDAVGFLEDALDIPTRLEPLKRLQKLAPLRSLRDLAPLKPLYTYSWSDTSLSAFLAGSASGNAYASPPRPRSTTSAGGGSYYGVGGRHWIQRTEGGGRIVVLEDGSRWEVWPVDRITAALWLPVSDIEVADARSPMGAFRYALINTDDDEVVLAKYLGR